MAKARTVPPVAPHERLRALQDEYEVALDRAPDPLDAPSERQALAARQYVARLRATAAAAKAAVCASATRVEKLDAASSRLAACRAENVTLMKALTSARTARATEHDPPRQAQLDREIDATLVMLGSTTAEVQRLEDIVSERAVAAEAARQREVAAAADWRACLSAGA